ncbi:pilus assembly protein [Lysobacteraceae bacterium NML93-0792]|nr:pilus assembly protein [Xanthomonadaceae bacterium NML93-0792]PBS15176.1 pilus assembly protein [Xanthomonadaceae bacterium NML93-0793]PBS18010.1 pilus assembly protein [Xanthomonadaceae bacterium NML93-0831]
MKRRTKLLAGATALALAGSAYFLHSVMAVQGQGVLAQQPLNVQRQIPPAFIMALDDSGSMLWENLNNTRDGVFGWQNNGAATGSFFNGNVPRGYDGVSARYYYVFPNYGRDGNAAIPPIDAFGFARSPDVNPGYFDPRLSYPTWKRANGTDYATTTATAATLDPRPAGASGRITGTLNLTANVESTVDNWRFQVRPGMILPADTRVRGNCNTTGQNIATGGAYQTLPDEKRVVQNCDLHFSFFPATFFLEDPASLPAAYGYTAAPVPVTDPPGGRPGVLYKYEIRRVNFASDDAYNAAIQNFANWFTFYRTRREGLIGGVLNALVDVKNMKVGWFRINDRRDVTMRDMSDETAKQALFNGIVEMRASGSTPSRQAVQYLGQQFQRTDANRPIQLSCQKNAGMLFTDGYINDAGSPAVGNLDRDLGAPFADTVSHTMADIVVPYYYDSLLPALEANAVPVPSACDSVPAPPLLPTPEQRRLDCRRNLHMNFYGIVLGTLGDQFGVTYLPDPSDPAKLVPDPYLNPPTWLARQDLTPRAVDEMWHATLNTRGEMINATSPSLITAAMRRVLASVSAGASPAGSIALTGARIGTGSLSVSPFYEARNSGTDWYSTLTAQSVSVNPLTGIVGFSNVWEASERLPAAADRAIFFGDTDGVAREFNATNVSSLGRLCDNPVVGMSRCTAGQLEALGGATDLTLDQAVNYLRGEQSLEAERFPNGRLRFRTTRLGDIVNASPVVSAPTDDYGYRTLPGTLGTSYATFMTAKSNAASTEFRRTMVYAGANDGMLHGFDGRTTAADGGVERFGFIPRSVMGHMGNLLFPYDAAASGDQRFQHRYYVDGPLVVSDARYGGNWKTVLVGSTGAGAKGVFALDVTSASRTTGSFTANDRLWEINSFHSNATVRDNIGHVLGRPVIVPVRTGAGDDAVVWRAIFGNGYNSTSGKAVLFMVDIGTGTPNVTMLEATEAGAPSGSNGLGNLVALDRYRLDGDSNLVRSGRDGMADTVYAADQKGAIWKFDLRPASLVPGGVVANPTTPLFTTLRYTSGAENGTRQPVLGGITAAAGRNGGVMLYFGTGSFSFEGDPSDSTLQSLYGVLDLANGQPAATLTRANLNTQTITATDSGVRTTSSNVPVTGRLGWHIDLPIRERFVGYPRVESGVVFMPTYAPVNAQQCSVEGANWLYGLNALSGGAGLSNVSFDKPGGTSPGTGTGALALNTQGTAPVKDVAIFSAPRVTPLAAGADPDDLDDALEAQCSMIVQVAGAPTMYLKRPCGRQSWRQIQ